MTAIRPLSLRTKLALATGVAAVCVSVFASAVLIGDLVSTATGRATDDVALAVDDLVSDLRLDPSLAHGGLEARSGGTRLRIVDLESGETLALSPEVSIVRRSDPESTQIDIEVGAASAGFPTDTPVAASRTTTLADGRLVRVDGARDDESLVALRRDLVARAVPAVPAVGLVAAIAAWLLAGRALAPVAGLTTEAGQIDDDSRQKRLPVPDSGDEIADLATGLNHMLDRLQAGRDREEALVSDVSHELRNPLAALISRLESAIAVEPDQPESHARCRSQASLALDHARRLTRMTDDLLEIARLDGTLGPEARLVDLADIAEAAANDLGDVEISGRAPPVYGDPQALIRMLANVVANGMIHGGERVQVTLSEDQGSAIVTVDDDGPGLAPEDRHRIFDRFVRLDEARDRHGQGTGLGLALVAATVRRHRGSVSIGDRPSGPGARVVITLPTASRSDSADAAIGPGRSV